MTDTLPRFSTPAIRLLVLTALVAVWAATLVWLWTDEASLSCFEYVPLEDAGSGPSCAELAEQEARRFNTWFTPVLIAGPAAGVALWFALRPRTPRTDR